MDQILFGLPIAQCYIDDMIIFTKLAQEHIKHLQAVFLAITRVRIADHD